MFYLLFAFLLLLHSCKKVDTLTLITTTSVANTGLIDAISKEFEKKHNVKVKTLAVGSGYAIRLAKDGNADLLITHAPDLEEEFINSGYGIEKIQFMYNHFVIAGPEDDPAKIRNSSPVDAFRKIYKSNAKFVSRGDYSGTHIKELNLWRKAGINQEDLSSRYITAAGGDMLFSLNVAAEKKAYILTDETTFNIFLKANKTLVPLVKKRSEEMLNPYSFLILNPLRFKGRNHELAKKFVRFVLNECGSIIREYGYHEISKTANECGRNFTN